MVGDLRRPTGSMKGWGGKPFKETSLCCPNQETDTDLDRSFRKGGQLEGGGVPERMSSAIPCRKSALFVSADFVYAIPSFRRQGGPSPVPIELVGWRVAPPLAVADLTSVGTPLFLPIRNNFGFVHSHTIQTHQTNWNTTVYFTSQI